jgi:hypothetical protein
MSRLRAGWVCFAALVVVAALVCAGLVVGNRNDAEASQIRADARALSRTSAHEQAVRQKAAAEAVARRQAAVDRAAARRAARERKAAEAQQAADEQAAREQAAEQRAARRQAAQERADRRKAAKAAAAAAALAAAGHELTGSIACPAGSGGGHDDIVAGARVTVRDGKGTVLATTVLTGGTPSTTGCTFAFRTHVPDADFYQVGVGHRGALTFSRDELDKKHWSVAARL